MPRLRHSPASIDRTFDRLMGDSMNVMHNGTHSAPHTGNPDRDFVTKSRSIGGERSLS